MDIQELRKAPHISASAIDSYTSCSLAYRFRYLDKLPSESVSDALVFGSAIHKVMADFYQALMIGNRLSLEELLARWETYWRQDAGDRDNIQWNRGNDFETALRGGQGLLEAFSHKFAMVDTSILCVEEPFSFEIKGLDIPVIGVFDLVIQDLASGDITVVDHKTASRKMSAGDADSHFQATVYSMAAKANGFRAQDLLLRFDVLVKTKEPKFSQVYTKRTAEDEHKAARKIIAVHEAIEKGVFFPSASWRCSGCGFKQACEDWLKEGYDHE